MLLALWLAVDLAFPKQKDIRLEIHGKPDYQGPVYFLAPHENEHVANAYLTTRVQEQGGKFLILRQKGERNILLKYGEAELAVDPNRIFTRAGARSSLLKLNPQLENKPWLLYRACRRAVRLGRFITKHMGGMRPGSIIIAIHNNTDGYDDDGKGGVGTVSIERYRKKFEAGSGFIKDLHVGEGDEDDLFFITEQEDFRAMSEAGWHVLLQHPRVAWAEDQDDGSLSVFAEMKGLRYINIEAQRKPDHLEVQKQMIELVFDLVPMDQ